MVLVIIMIMIVIIVCIFAKAQFFYHFIEPVN